MIQRIQTLYFALSAIFLMLAMFLPLAEYSVDNASVGAFNLLALNTASEVLTLPVSVMVMAVLALAIMAIFRYQDRALQIRLARIGALLSLATFAVFAIFHYLTIINASEKGELTISYSFTVLAPVFAAVFMWLGMKAVQKDDEKIKSVDRLR